MPANIIGPGQPALVGSVREYLSPKGWEILPPKPQYIILQHMGGKELASLSTAIQPLYGGGIDRDTVEAIICEPYNAVKSARQNQTTILHNLMRMKTARMEAEANNVQANWIPNPVFLNNPNGLVQLTLVNLRNNVWGLPDRARILHHDTVRFNCIGWTNREITITVAAILGFAGVYHDNRGGQHGAVCRRIIAACAATSLPTMNHIILFTDGLRAIGDFAVNPPTVSELDAVINKFCQTRPLRVAATVADELNSATSYQVRGTSVGNGGHLGTINDVPMEVQGPQRAGYGQMPDALASNARGGRRHIYLEAITTPFEYFMDLFAIQRADSMSRTARSDQQDAQENEPDNRIGAGPEDQVAGLWQSIKHMFGYSMQRVPNIWLLEARTRSEMLSYAVTTAGADAGNTGTFYNGALVAGAVGIQDNFQGQQELTAYASVPYDGLGSRVRTATAVIFNLRLSSSVAALARLEDELGGNCGYYRYCRDTRPHGTQPLCRADRIAMVAKKLPFWEILQGLDAPGDAPPGFETKAKVVRLAGAPGPFWFTPKLTHEVSKTDEAAGGFKVEASAEEGSGKAMTNPMDWTNPTPQLQFLAFDAEGYKYAFRLVQQAMQRFPNDWGYAMPPQDSYATSNADLGLANAVALVFPANVARGDITDTLSILPIQGHFALEMVQWGKTAGNMTQPQRLLFRRLLTGGELEGVGGVLFDTPALKLE
jgi:hypothetical protein